MSRSHLSSALSRRAALVSIASASFSAVVSAPAMAIAAVQKHIEIKVKEQKVKEQADSTAEIIAIDDPVAEPAVKPIDKADVLAMQELAAQSKPTPCQFLPYRRPRFVIPRYWLHRPDYRFAGTPSKSHGISGAARRRRTQTRQGK